MQTQHTFESWDLGAGDSLAANAATRNVVVSHPLVNLPIRGSGVAVNLMYNAKDTANLGMGPGWRLDVFRRLRLHGDGTITFSDGSGARHTFSSPVTVGAITTYTRPATLYATLVKDTGPNPDRFSLTYADQSVDEFDVADGEGLLVRAEDRFGNGVDLAYVGATNKLATITDTVPSPDRVIDLAWSSEPTPNRLTTVTDWAYVSAGTVQTTTSGSRRAHRFSYDTHGQLTGWSDPADSAGSCPTPASHRTCLAYTGNLLTAIAKTQTITDNDAGTLGTEAREITTEITYSGSDVVTITDAHQQAQGSPLRTTFTAESSTVLRVDRPTTTTTYGQVGAADAYGRIQSVWRKLDGSTSLETRTTFDGTYPIEPATVTANYGALLSTPARTTTYSYVASSMGLLSKIVEPLTATDDRWTEFAYNTNNDVVLETVSAEGSSTDTTVTKSCYTTQSNSCSDGSPGLTLVRRIDRWVSGGASDEDTNVVTDYGYDAYGQLTSTTRANRDGAGSLLDDREDRQTYDDKGNLTSEITNYANGTITPGSIDTDPAAGGARTDLTTSHTYDTAGNRVSTADPRRAIANTTTTHVVDGFGRTVTDGWGTADTGGSWTGTNADFDVGSGIGTIAIGTGVGRDANLTAVSARDVEFLVKVRVDRTVSGGDVYAAAHLRRQDSSNFYQARLTYSPTGVLKISARKTAAGTSTVLGSEYTSLAPTTSDWYWFRGQVTGTTSVSFKLRAWKDGTTEPGNWGVEATDGSPPAGLQGNGHVGIHFSSSGSYTGATPITGSFDSLALTSVGGVGLAADDYVTRSTFDPLDQPITGTTPTTPGLTSAQGSTTTVYDELGSVRRTTDVADLVTATVFDRAGRALTTYEDPDPAGSAYILSQSTYDQDGKTLTALDRRQAADPGLDLGWTAVSYDGLGRTTSVTEAESSSPDVEAETRTTYDGLDRVTITEVGYGSTSSQRTELTLDLGGRATETDDGFACTTATFDYRDLVQVSEDSLDTSTCAANADSRELTNAYDGLGRLVAAEVTGGPDTGDQPTIATYDAAGNVLTSADETASVTTTSTFIRNLLGQVVAEARGDGSDAKTTYDPAGNPVDRCTWASGATVGDCLAVGTAGWTNPPTNSTTTRWDARNGRIGLTDLASNRTSVYDPDNGYQVAATYLPTNADQTKEHQSVYGYDSRHRLTSITHQLCTVSTGHACSADPDTGTVIYEYDDADNRTTVNENNGSASAEYRYCYDARNQLIARRTAAACTSSPDETFTFDDAGNRTQAVTAGPTTTNFAYSAEGLLCDQETGAAASCTGGNITSDDAGRISDVSGWHYLYDAQARLVSACDDADCVGTGFDRLDFTYDGEGHRTAILATPASGPAVETTFRYQGDAIVAEYVDGTLTREYVTDDTGTISKVIVPSGGSAGTYLVTWNGHGDALALYKIESTGALTLANSYTYTTWGTPTTATHNSIADLGFRFLYVGAWDVQWDATYGVDLLYMHARHYSPSLGRFLQPDPSRLDAQLFVYAANGPVSKVDPAGDCWYCQVLQKAQEILQKAAPFIQKVPGALKVIGDKFGKVQHLAKFGRPVRVLGNKPHNFHVIGSGPSKGFIRWVSSKDGGVSSARNVFKNLTGRYPNSTGEHWNSYHNYLEVRYRQVLGNHEVVVEIINRVTRTLEKIHFPPTNGR